MTTTNHAGWRQACASFKTHEDNQPHHFKLFELRTHRKTLTALFHTHDFTDAHNWFVFDRGKVMPSFPPRNHGKFYSIRLPAIGGWDVIKSQTFNLLMIERFFIPLLSLFIIFLHQLQVSTTTPVHLHWLCSCCSSWLSWNTRVTILVLPSVGTSGSYICPQNS